MPLTDRLAQQEVPSQAISHALSQTRSFLVIRPACRPSFRARSRYENNDALPPRASCIHETIP